MNLQEILADIKLNPKTALLNLLFILLILGLIVFGMSIGILLVGSPVFAFIILLTSIASLFSFAFTLYFTASDKKTKTMPNLFFKLALQFALTPPEWAPLFLESTQVAEFWQLIGNKKNWLYFIEDNKIFLISRFAALAFGIYLSFQIFPFIIAGLATTGFAHGLAIFVGLFASMLLIYMTDLAFNLPALLMRGWMKFIEISLMSRHTLFGNSCEGFNGSPLLLNVFLIALTIPNNVTALISVCSALSAVLPGVSYGLVVFITLAVGIALLFFLARSLQFLGGFIFKAISASWEAISEWRSERTASLDASLNSEKSNTPSIKPVNHTASKLEGTGTPRSEQPQQQGIINAFQ